MSRDQSDDWTAEERDEILKEWALQFFEGAIAEGEYRDRLRRMNLKPVEIDEAVEENMPTCLRKPGTN